MKHTDILRKLTVTGFLISLGACSSLSQGPGAPAVGDDYQESITKYTVQPGDRLGDIALELTGDAAQWQQIASINDISDPRSLRAGVTIEIPSELLLRPEAEKRVDPGDPEVDPSGAATGASMAITDSRTQSESVASARLEPAADATTVVISAAAIDRDFAGQPLASPQDATATEPHQRVQVIGTYYPKGIYARPSDASLLLMRVAPGTQFESDGQIDSWYRVLLDEDIGDGVGYVRASDARELQTGSSL